MDGFLVIARCRIDDVPMGLFDTREKAVEFARGLTPDDVAAESDRVMNINPSHAIGVSVIEFEGGEPRRGGELVVDFEDD